MGRPDSIAIDINDVAGLCLFKLSRWQPDQFGVEPSNWCRTAKSISDVSESNIRLQKAQAYDAWLGMIWNPQIRCPISDFLARFNCRSSLATRVKLPGLSCWSNKAKSGYKRSNTNHDGSQTSYQSYHHASAKTWWNTKRFWTVGGRTQFSQIRPISKAAQRLSISRGPAYLVRHPPDLLRCRYFLPQELYSVIALNRAYQSVIRMMKKNWLFCFSSFSVLDSCKQKRAHLIVKDRKPIVTGGEKVLNWVIGPSRIFQKWACHISSVQAEFSAPARVIATIVKSVENTELNWCFW